MADLTDELADRGFTIRQGLFEEDYLHNLTREAWAMWSSGAFRRSDPMREAETPIENRTHHMVWLDPVAPNGLQDRYLQIVGEMRSEWARQLFLPMNEFEAQFAIYPAGLSYRRHIDQSQQSQRLVTCLLYLNADWQRDDGGELCIFEPPGEDGDEREVLVLPELGTFVAFLSDRIEHEVRPARRERLSLKGWLRRARTP